MKKIVLVLVLGLVLGISTSAFALLTPISVGGEPALALPGGILDSIYGLSNLSRIDDDDDQFWKMTTTGTATGIAKYAAYNQTLRSGQTFGTSQFILNIPGTPLGTPINFTEVGNFKFYDDPSGEIPWSTLISENSDQMDHVVSWKITGNILGKGDYILAWEDTNSAKSDRDYNDMVFQFSGITPAVPEPSSLMLLGMGILGLFGLGKKKL